MEEESCPHLGSIKIEEVKKILNNKELRYCEKCTTKAGKTDKDKIQTADVLYICLNCSHVGCSRGKEAHALQHFESNPKHSLALKLNGEIFCYECGHEARKLMKKDEAMVAQLQKILKDALQDKEESKFPTSMDVEEEKGTTRPSHLLTTDIDKINEKLETKLLEEACKYSKMNGLGNMGNTCYFNSMLQCIQATMPLVDLFHTDAEAIKGSETNTLAKFTREYQKNSAYSLTPSSVLSIISKKKYYFGNFSQQDSYDALLTLLDTLITEQKKLYKAEKGIPDPIQRIPDSVVQLGRIFGFFLSSKLTCKLCNKYTWCNDPSITVHAALSRKKSIISAAEEKSEDLRYVYDEINGIKVLLPNKQTIIANLKGDSNIDVDYCLRRFFEPEALESKSDYITCETCKKKNASPAIKEFFLLHPPQILIVYLKRFSSSGYMWSKNSQDIDTLENIFLDDYVILDEETLKILKRIYGPGVEERIKAARCHEKPLKLFPYSLYAISSHSGSLYGGHYIAYVKHGKKWYYVSDSHYSEISLSRVLKAEAYVLYYQRLWD